MPTTSRREQILARCAAVLTGATPAGASVYRARETAIIRAAEPAICVLYGGGSVHRMGSGFDQHRLTINIALYVRGDPWDSLVDALDVPAHAALLADATLKNMGVELMRESDAAEAQEADRTAGCLTVAYIATFYTRPGDISAAP